MLFIPPGGQPDFPIARLEHDVLEAGTESEYEHLTEPHHQQTTIVLAYPAMVIFRLVGLEEPLLPLDIVTVCVIASVHLARNVLLDLFAAVANRLAALRAVNGVRILLHRGHSQISTDQQMT
jgi:hypothetical protein